MFNEVNPQEQLFGLTKHNIGNYEGFATWLEALLCEETGNHKLWQLKKNRLPDDSVSLFEFFQDAEQKLTRFGFISQLGFPKFYDREKLLTSLTRIYGSLVKDANFIILYGSRKPCSDIDLCVISPRSSFQTFNGWLDLAVVNTKEFKYRVFNLDIAVTDPLFSGELIKGDTSAFNALKKQIIRSEIMEEAIIYNLRKAETMREYLPHYNNSRLREICESYAESYLRNAEFLAKGVKPLTLKRINELLTAQST